MIGETARGQEIRGDDQARGGVTHNYFSGNLMTPEFWEQIHAGDANAAMQGAAGGAAMGVAGATGAIAGTANWASGGRLADAASSVSGATITASKAAQAYLGATPAAQGANAAIKALRNSKKSQA